MFHRVLRNKKNAEAHTEALAPVAATPAATNVLPHAHSLANSSGSGSASAPAATGGYKTSGYQRSAKGFSPCRAIFRQTVSRNSDRKPPARPGCRTAHRSTGMPSAASVARGLVPVVVGPAHDVCMYVSSVRAGCCVCIRINEHMHACMHACT